MLKSLSRVSDNPLTKFNNGSDDAEVTRLSAPLSANKSKKKKHGLQHFFVLLLSAHAAGFIGGNQSGGRIIHFQLKVYKMTCPNFQWLERDKIDIFSNDLGKFRALDFNFLSHPDKFWQEMDDPVGMCNFQTTNRRLSVWSVANCSETFLEH